jgi:hypothetical protein
MADASGQADIRGIDIDRLVKGFADEENVFKKFVVNSTTTAREIRWYQKTSGFLDTPDTSGITTSHISNNAQGALPFVAEQSWTRNTSYVKKFFVESPLFSIEDLKDSDVDLLATNVRDLVRAVQRKQDLRIYSVITEASAATPTIPNPSNVHTAAATGTGWDDTTNGDPIDDILLGKQKMRASGYDPEGSVLLMNPIEHRFLLDYLINTKGSSIPQFSSEKVRDGVVMEILGCNVLVSQNATTDYVIQWIPDRSATLKTFMPITSAVITDPGIGKKVRVWIESECLLTDPKSVNVITDTTT